MSVILFSNRKRTRQTTQSAGEWQQPSFEQATNIDDVVRLRKSLRRRMIAMRIVTLLLVLAALIVGMTPFVLQWRTTMQLNHQSQAVQRQAEALPQGESASALDAAHAYNEKLAKSGQPVLGEAIDPFSSTAGGSGASNNGVSEAAKDTEYQSLLNSGDGIMGSVTIPKISVTLPVYHGTSEKVLAAGAGHLYGTSLPVGGASTHSVITGHRGLVAAPMFTRLDEMNKGDYFYIDSMGQKIAYEVDRISVITPDDTSQLRIVPGEDRVTLMTCTPYGVNTHRLLVSGHRVDIPYPAPEPNNVYDARLIGIVAGIATLLLGLLLCALTAARRRPPMRMRHARVWKNVRNG